MTSTTSFAPDIAIRSSNWLFVTYIIVVGGTCASGVEDVASNKVLVEVSSPGQSMHISLSFDACVEAFEHVQEATSIGFNLDRTWKLAKNDAAMTHLGEAIGSIKTIGTLEFKSCRNLSGAAEVPTTAFRWSPPSQQAAALAKSFGVPRCGGNCQLQSARRIRNPCRPHFTCCRQRDNDKQVYCIPHDFQK